MAERDQVLLQVLYLGHVPAVSLQVDPHKSVMSTNKGDLGLIPGLGRSPGGGHGNPLQYSFLENPMDRGTWWATVHGVAKGRTRLSD